MIHKGETSMSRRPAAMEIKRFVGDEGAALAAFRVILSITTRRLRCGSLMRITTL